MVWGGTDHSAQHTKGERKIRAANLYQMKLLTRLSAIRQFFGWLVYPLETTMQRCLFHYFCEDSERLAVILRSAAQLHPNPKLQYA